LPHADWEVHPTTPWNYALALDRRAPSRSVRIRRRPAGETLFSPQGVPLYAEVEGAQVPTWGLERGTAAPPPCSLVGEAGPRQMLRLIPYGATNLRIAEFPTLPVEATEAPADAPMP